MSAELPAIGDVRTEVIGGLHIRYARSGASKGIPVLLTSPWPESIYAFRGVLPSIAKVGPLIAVDLPGFGHSESRPDVMSPEAMGGFIVELARYFKIERMHAVGPDVGALGLLFAASSKPKLFESLVVGSGATSVDLAGSGLKAAIASPVGYFAAKEGGELAVQFVEKNAAIATPPSVLEDYRLSSAGQRFETAANYVRAYQRDLPRLRGLLPTIETPVFIIAGQNDAIVPPPNGQLLADHLPHNRYWLLYGGHLVWEDAAESYAAALAEWFHGGYKTVGASLHR